MENEKYNFGISKIMQIYLMILAAVLVSKDIAQIINGSDFKENIIGIVFVVIVAFTVNYFTHASYYFKNNYFMRKGFMGSPNLADITKIHIPQNDITIEYSEDGEMKSLKIKSYFLEHDLEKARKLIKTILSRVGESAEVDEKVIDFAKGKKDRISESDYSKLKGSLIVLIIVLLLFLILNIYEAFLVGINMFLNYNFLYAVEGILFVIVSVWGIVCLALLLKKKMRSIKAIKLYRIYYVVHILMVTVTAYLLMEAMEDTVTALPIFEILADILKALFITLAILEYLKTSIRVKKTLIK